MCFNVKGIRAHHSKPKLEVFVPLRTLGSRSHDILRLRSWVEELLNLSPGKWVGNLYTMYNVHTYVHMYSKWQKGWCRKINFSQLTVDYRTTWLKNCSFLSFLCFCNINEEILTNGIKSVKNSWQRKKTMMRQFFTFIQFKMLKPDWCELRLVKRDIIW